MFLGVETLFDLVGRWLNLEQPMVCLTRVFYRAIMDLWADGAAKVLMEDTKSSKGILVNGERLSAENQTSGSRELRVGDRLEFGRNEVREVNGKPVTEHSISANVDYVGFPSRSDELRLDLIAPATKKDEENRTIALASTEEIGREGTAEFKIWEAGMGEAEQV